MKRFLFLAIVLIAFVGIHEITHWVIDQNFGVCSHFEINWRGLQTVPENQAMPELVPYLLLSHNANEIFGYSFIAFVMLWLAIKLFEKGKE